MAESVSQPCLDLVELDRLLRAADPTSRLIAPRLLRRIIQHDRRLTGLGLHVPHHKSYLVDREKLVQLADRDEFGAPSELPAQLLLIARPEPAELAALPRDGALLAYWRLLFHGAVHRAIAGRIARHQLSPAAVRERIHRIGQVEFNEIRTVLRQEGYLLPPRDELTAYEEFAALYLELSYFAVTLLPDYFPAIEHFKVIDALLAEDVDAAALFAATRPAGAPDPDFHVDGPARPERLAPLTSFQSQRAVSPEQARELLASAERASSTGNVVRAALRRTRAGASAQAEVDRLVDRLRKALHLSDADAEPWRQALTPLLSTAAHGAWPAEARLLYDLQKVCVEQERPVSELNPVEWLYSGFRQPLVRPLPNQLLVLAVGHLRRAVGRLPAIRVTEVERHALAVRLHDALHHAEARLRERFRPLLTDALHTVGLCPQNFPERTAHDQLIEELLDQITEHGFLNIGHLRDALARNQLKLPDLTGPGEFFTGDPLLRANRELAVHATGVYQRGEVYLRWLQRGSALTFGTRLGRWLTRFVALPFGGAYATIVFVLEMLHLGQKLLHRPLFELHSPALETTIAVLGVFYLLLLHWPAFRRLMGHGFTAAWTVARALVVDLPLAVWQLPTLRQLLASRPFVIFVRYVLKPSPAGVLAWLFLWVAGFSPTSSWLGGVTALLAASLLVNSRWARELEESLYDWAARRWDYLRELVPGLIRWLLDIFKSSLEAIDRFLYAVDEWLRFRGGEQRLTRVVKGVLGLAWSLIAYVIRLGVIVFIEPTVNPVKHFPVVTVAAKLLVPFWYPLTKFFAAPLMFLGEPLADSIAFLGIHILPGAAGFLAWELQANWRLYRTNRSRTLKPAAIGHHGETLVRLLKPGFHSGTLPKLFAKLRRAERRALRTQQWQAPRQLRAALHHVEAGIRRFAERELLAYPNGCRDWTAGPVHLASVEAGSNRVRLEIACPALGPSSLELKFEEQSGWLLAHVARPGWLPGLSPEQRAILTTALTGFYQRCGVDLVREQLEASLPQPCPPYDVSEKGLVVWPGQGYETEVLYDLRQRPEITPRVVSGKLADGLPVLQADQILFSRQEVTWLDWLAAWDEAPKPCGRGAAILPGKSDVA